MKRIIILIVAILLFSRAITTESLLNGTLTDHPFSQGYSVYADDEKNEEKSEKNEEEDHEDKQEEDDDDDDDVRPTRVPTKEPTQVPVIIISPVPTKSPIPPVLATIDQSVEYSQQDTTTSPYSFIQSPDSGIGTTEAFISTETALATAIPTEVLERYIVTDTNANGIVDSWE